MNTQLIILRSWFKCWHLFMLAAFPRDEALCVVVIYVMFVLRDFTYISWNHSFCVKRIFHAVNNWRKAKGSWVDVPLLPNDTVQGINHSKSIRLLFWISLKENKQNPVFFPLLISCICLVERFPSVDYFWIADAVMREWVSLHLTHGLLSAFFPISHCPFPK